MSKESYARGFCKAAEAAGVDPVVLAKFAQQGYFGIKDGPSVLNAELQKGFERAKSMPLAQAAGLTYSGFGPGMLRAAGLNVNIPGATPSAAQSVPHNPAQAPASKPNRSIAGILKRLVSMKPRITQALPNYR